MLCLRLEIGAQPKASTQYCPYCDDRKPLDATHKFLCGAPEIQRITQSLIYSTVLVISAHNQRIGGGVVPRERYPDVKWIAMALGLLPERVYLPRFQPPYTIIGLTRTGRVRWDCLPVQSQKEFGALYMHTMEKAKVLASKFEAAAAARA
jgi:hypothetical protein